MHAVIAVLVVGRWSNAPQAGGSPVAIPGGDLPRAAGNPAFVELIDDAERGAAPPVVAGPGDTADFRGQHPMPGADLDMPGRAPAAHGGGAAGGTASWTGRQDAHDIQSQTWSDPDRNLLPRTDTGARERSPEAIARAPERAYGDRTERRRKAREGHVAGRTGTDSGGDHGAPTGIEGERWDEADPWFDAARSRRDQRAEGSTRATPATALTDRGTPATDTHRKGAAADDRSTIAASDATEPLAFEMTRNRAGGRTGGDGVAGARPGAGVSARSQRRGAGTAATSAPVPAGPGGTSVRAARTNPYFRSMYERLDGRIEYPRELALRMEQGEVTVTFRLLADGRVADITVSSSSGFDAFDREVTEAIRDEAPYGRVPAAVLGGRTEVLVRAPYAFRNRMIR